MTPQRTPSRTKATHDAIHGLDTGAEAPELRQEVPQVLAPPAHSEGLTQGPSVVPASERDAQSQAGWCSIPIVRNILASLFGTEIQ